MTPSEMSALYALAFEHERPWTSDEFAALQSDPAVHVFDSPESFLIARIVVDECEILTLATRPEVRGQGKARRLLEALMAACESKGVQSIFLEVAKTNAAAIGLYRSFGFGEVGRRKQYYAFRDGTRVDALVMRKIL